jgi:hypothetical protein
MNFLGQLGGYEGGSERAVAMEMRIADRQINKPTGN